MLKITNESLDAARTMSRPTYRVTNDSLRPDIAWAAGLFEGEGSVGLYSGTTTASVQMTDRDVLDQFQKIVGMGRIKGPYKPSRSGRKVSWKWLATKYAEVARLFQMFMPWLCERRRARFTAILSGRQRHPIKPVPDSPTPFCGRGTSYGYERHIRRGEPPCTKCRAAKRAYRRGLKRNRSKLASGSSKLLQHES